MAPQGSYSYTPNQRNTSKCFVETVGTFHLTNNGFALVEPLSSASFSLYQCWSNGYAQKDRYMYTWLNVGGRSLCLVTHYNLVVGIGSEDVVSAGAQWGVYCYGRMPSYGCAAYVFNGVDAFIAGGLWIPTSSFPRPVTTDDVIDWVTNGTSDPFGFLPRASGCAFQVSLSSLSGNPCSYTGSTPDLSACSKSILLTGHADDYDKSYVFRPMSEYEWADLSDSAIDGCRFLDINSISYLKEAVAYVRSIVTFLITKKVSVPTDVGSSWLSARYGMRLTLNDSKSLVDAAKRALSQDLHAFSVTRARSTEHLATTGRNIIDYKREATYKVYYNRKDDPALKVIRTAMDWDLWPTLANDWDLIPFSFVVDWFVDVQGLLEDLDNSVYEAYLSILSVLYTEKHIYVHDPDFFSSGSWKCVSCEHVYYHRRHSPSLHYAPLRLERGHLANINVIDGVSLVMQRTTR